MKRVSAGPILTTVFVDYDNIYLSLKRKSEDAAKRFAKDSGLWLQGILNGELITPTSPFAYAGERRVVMNRCYGNPVPRRNSHDNSTDMNSFPFIRHHFLRSGFEVIDCPPLTAQLKNSADIRIVMDIRDILNHDTYFDEFIILSGDADFTPVLHRLRAHARRTVVFANDHTAQPYTAISDGEIRESNLINLLLGARAVGADPAREIAAQPVIDVEEARKAILSEVTNFVRAAPQAVPLETLADRAVRLVGRDKTVGTNWGGYGSFRELLLADLPDDIHLSDTPPYTVFDASRHISSTGLIAPQLAPPVADPSPAPVAATPAPAAAPRREPQIPAMTAELTARIQQPAPAHSQQPAAQRPAYQPAPTAAPIPGPAAAPVAAEPRQSFGMRPAAPHTTGLAASEPRRQAEPARVPEPPMQRQPLAAPPAQTAVQHAQPAEPRREPQLQQQTQRPASAPAGHAPAPQQPRTAEQASQMQQSIARIHEACQAPALAPAEYRVLFDVMAQEINTNGLQGSQTLANITQRAREYGLDLKRDDLRFVLDVVSESDPWFEQGASAILFASRFRNFVVARCRSQGLSLSADELDLIELWFAAPQPQAARQPAYGRPAAPTTQQPAQQAAAPAQQPRGAEPWWSLEESRQSIAEQRGDLAPAHGEREDEFPRIVRSRLRG